MNDIKASGPPAFRGRNFGIAALVAFQYAIGGIHIVFGLVLMVFGGPDIYSSYTLAFSVLVIAFAYGLWQGKGSGWAGTVAVSLFVIVADSLTILNLPSIPGIPKAAGFGEIFYSGVVVAYLFQANIRAHYKILI